MKRFAAREFALLCAPLAIVGLAALVPRLLHPPKDPNAVISLMVKQTSARFSRDSLFARLEFDWQAQASGGPEYGYRIGFHEQIVAITRTGETVIYADPPFVRSANTSSSLGSDGVTPEKFATMIRGLGIDAVRIPLAAQRLEWRGEVVAVPRENGFIYSIESAATLANLAITKSAARVVKVIRLPFDAAKNAIARCQTEPVNATNASKGIDTCLTVETRDQNRAVCRRLVAFDGRTRRVLWDDDREGVNKLGQGENSSLGSGWTSSNLLFKLSEVPRAWGEITFLYDVVFPAVTPPPNAAPASMSGTRVDLGRIEALERAGGLRFSRRVVVRRAGEVIAAPKYKKTPNLKLVRVKTAKVGSVTQILATLRYFGPRAEPEIDVVDFEAVFDTQGKNVNLKSFGLSRGKTSRDWIAKLELSPHPPNLAGRFKVEIGDGDAMPLKIDQKLVLP